MDKEGSSDLQLGEQGKEEAGSDGNAGTEMKTLEASIKSLAISQDDNCRKAEEISKLEVARIQSADEKRLARRTAWIAKTQKEVMERADFKTWRVLDIFPKLVWRRIFEQVEDSKEKKTLSNMNLVWRDLLKMERTSFLFHEVFPLLHMGGHLSRNDVINCRVASREWNESIENAFQNYHIFEPPSLLQIFKMKPNVWEKVDGMMTKFQADGVKVASFLEWSKSSYPSNGNPFFSRAVRLGCDCPHDDQSHFQFWAQVARLLAEWGKDIWKLEIQFSRINPFDSEGVYRMICGILKLLPNLRCLQLNSVSQMQDSTLLNMRIKELPLPEMPNLKYISAKFMPPAMLKAMLKKFGPTLHTFGICGKEYDQKVYGGTRLPALKMLSLQSTASSWAEGSKYKFTVNWPSIETLDLNYDNIEAVGIPKLFEAINEIGGGLLKLDLKLQKQVGPPSKLGAVLTKTLSLELPKLQYFSLAMSRANLRSIDFILPMVSLKELTLCYFKYVEVESGAHSQQKKISKKGTGRKAGPSAIPSASVKEKKIVSANDDSEEIIKFWKYTNRLYESNIWRLLPELKKVTIIALSNAILTKGDLGTSHDFNNASFKERVYTRSGFNQQQ